MTDHLAEIRSQMVGYHARAFTEMEPRQDPRDAGVPASMADGPGRFEGCVRWRLVDSPVTEEDVDALEAELGHRLPPRYRAYLRAFAHLFDQVHAHSHGERQLVMLPAMPDDRPLHALRDFCQVWQHLLKASLVPIAEWGDGWGPVCLDTTRRDASGDCPLVWIDHEVAVPLGAEGCADRSQIEAHLQQLYDSSWSFLDDIFAASSERG